MTQPNSVVGRVARQSSNASVALLNQRVGRVVLTRPDLCDPGYLYWYLFDPETRFKIASMAHGAASQANVSPSQVSSLRVPLPPLAEQQRIGAILSAYEDLLAANSRRIEILEEMASRVYEQWFIQFRFPGSAECAPTNFGCVPNGWEIRQATEILDFVKGVEPGRNAYFTSETGDTVPFLRVGDLSKPVR
jgi:type I restriction enzyme S subunit